MNLSSSKKITGLIITGAALLGLFLAYIIASLFVDVSDVVITSITSALTALGLGHQGAQAAADRSPNYNPPPAQPLFPPRPPGAP